MDPVWRTLDLLEHTMHRQVRHEHAGHAQAVKCLSANEVQIDYVSTRRMWGLAVGILRGLATYCDEADRIAVTLTTSTEG